MDGLYEQYKYIKTVNIQDALSGTHAASGRGATQRRQQLDLIETEQHARDFARQQEHEGSHDILEINPVMFKLFGHHDVDEDDYEDTIDDDVQQHLDAYARKQTANVQAVAQHL